MPYIPLLDSSQVRTDKVIEPAVHKAKLITLSSVSESIANVSNNPVSLIRWPCCAAKVVAPNMTICPISFSRLPFCCLQNHAKKTTAYLSNPSPPQCTQNESTLNNAPHVSWQFRPKATIQSVGHQTSHPPHTTSLPNASNHNHIIITKENQFNAWKVLLEEYEAFPFDKQINIYNHIVGHLTELTLPAREQLVVLLEQLILKKDYECPTSHRMEEMYMAAYKSLEKKK
jgi:hypothetical protein